MADIQYWDDEFAETLDSLRKSVRGLNSIKTTSAKTGAIQECEAAADRLNNLKRTFKLELRQLPKGEQGTYQEKLAGYEKELMQLRQEIKWAKTEDQKSSLMASSSRKKGGESGENVTRDEMLTGALEVQGKTKNVAARILKEIEDTKRVGGAIVEDLDAQTKTIKDVTDSVNKMEDDMVRANLLLRTFIRRMMTDKLIMVFALLIFFGVVFAVIYNQVVGPSEEKVVVYSGGSGNTPPPLLR